MKIERPKIEVLNVRNLSTLPFNRAINVKHITILLNSMVRYGVLRLPVIVRTKIFGGKHINYILDAQHMVEALLKADCEVMDCIVIEEDDITKIVDTMAALNNTANTWKVDDYVNAYCYMPGKEDYKLLKIHHLSTGFNYTVSSKILSGNANVIKNGKFKINCSDADIVTKNLIDVTSLFNTDQSKFMMAYITFSRSIKNYDHKKFMQLAARKVDSFLILHDTVVMVNALNQLYK